jgi:hypothetical protein
MGALHAMGCRPVALNKNDGNKNFRNLNRKNRLPGGLISP